MSKWTHIDATIRIDFGNQTRYWIERFFGEEVKDSEYSLCYDPKKKGDGCEITGSEMNAVVTYSRLREFENDPRNRYFRGNEWVVTVSGDLRDRMFEETLAEWRRFAWKLGMFVKSCKLLDGLDSEDDTVHFAGIDFWTVDIFGISKDKDGVYKDTWYHRSSSKKREGVIRA